MEIQRPDKRANQVSETPKVTVSFAETADDSIIDVVLGILLQSFSK